MGELSSAIVQGTCCAFCTSIFVDPKTGEQFSHGHAVACEECWTPGCGYKKAEVGIMVFEDMQNMENFDADYSEAHECVDLVLNNKRFYASINENYREDKNGGIKEDDSYTIVLLHPDRGTMIFIMEYNTKKGWYTDSDSPPESEILDVIIENLPYRF